MHHHGKGVYTGTFSGTLNPALQDRHGRPKRDISTIIHILNDLLCATPATTATGHYRYHHRHTSSRQQTASASTTLPASPPTMSSTAFAVSSNDASSLNSGLHEFNNGCSGSSNPAYLNGKNFYTLIRKIMCNKKYF